MGTYEIYEDSRNQTLNVNSPISGPKCFKWNQNLEAWTDIHNNFQLEGFLEYELNDYIDSFIFEV